MDLTDDEVREILDLIDKSNFDFLELEIGELKLTVSKGAHVPEQAPAAATPVRDDEPPAALKEPATGPTSGTPAPSQIDGDDRVPVAAPMVGTFYAAPKPGAPPFVEKGSRVTPDTTVGLIEVMKVFTGVRADVDGVIDEILVSDAEFVEYGRVLFLVDPTGDAA